MNIVKKIFKYVPGISWFIDTRRKLSLIKFQAAQQTRIQQQLYQPILCKARVEQGTTFPAAFVGQRFLLNNPRQRTDLPS
jgi:hypothetical protein